MTLIKVKSRGTDNVSGRRNIIINGAMQLSQRIGTTATAITGGNYGLDRWGMYYDGNSWTTQQVVDAPAGFYNSIKLTVTGTTTPNYSFFGQRIEGLNVNHIGLGTANCQSFTVSFYVKSSVAGVYSISMTNGAGDLAYPVQYTINSANTWERKSMTIPPITSGTWVKDTTNGLYLRINLGSPDSRTAAANGWRSGNFDGADGSTGAVTWATTSGATFFMTGCQIEVGDSASDFEHRSFGEELALCQRYYFKSMDSPPADNIPNTDTTSGNGYMGFAMYSNSAGRTPYFYFPVEMRADPTITVYSSERANTSGKFAVFTGNWGATSTSTPAVDIKRVAFSVTTAGGTSSGNSYLMAGGFDANAEL